MEIHRLPPTYMPFSLGISDMCLSYQIKLSSPYPVEAIHLPDRSLAHAPGVGTIFGRFCQISLHQRFEPRMYHVTNPSPENLYKPAQTQITSFLWVPWPTGIVWLMIVFSEFRYESEFLFLCSLCLHCFIFIILISFIYRYNLLLTINYFYIRTSI